jgi:hypothetical protein
MASDRSSLMVSSPVTPGRLELDPYVLRPVDGVGANVVLISEILGPRTIEPGPDRSSPSQPEG